VIDRDHAIRQAAFIHFAQLDRQFSEAVPWLAIQAGFLFHGECIYLGITQRGIHRPTQLQHSVLSIKNTKSKQRRTARSDDAIGSDDYFVYAFQGRDPSNHHNTCLRDAFEDHTPLVNIYALILGVYQILFSCYLMGWSPRALRSTLAVVSLYELGRSEIHDTAHPIDRSYRTIEAKVRLHQAQFRELVLGAYGRRRVISRIPIPGLPEAAYIIPDRDQRGHPEVSNRLCLSTLHPRRPQPQPAVDRPGRCYPHR
jgi:putative restriction endonuclease